MLSAALLFSQGWNRGDITYATHVLVYPPRPPPSPPLHTQTHCPLFPMALALLRNTTKQIYKREENCMERLRARFRIARND